MLVDSVIKYNDINKLRKTKSIASSDSSDSEDEDKEFSRRFVKLKACGPILNYEPPLPIGPLIVPSVLPITIFELNELNRKFRNPRFNSLPRCC